MLRYKTKTRPGLVALYKIRPGNGVGRFLQPRSICFNKSIPLFDMCPIIQSVCTQKIPPHSIGEQKTSSVQHVFRKCDTKCETETKSHYVTGCLVSVVSIPLLSAACL